jgi:hypothetical protein
VAGDEVVGDQEGDRLGDVVRRADAADRGSAAGDMIFEHMSFSIDDGSDMKLIVYTPLAGESTVAKMESLLQSASAAVAPKSKHEVDEAVS